MFPEVKLILFITTRSIMINEPECGGEKARQTFSVALVFEVKILWTGPENIFPRSRLKVAPSENDHLTQ